MPLVGIGTLPTPLSPASVPLPPETGGRWHTSLRVITENQWNWGTDSHQWEREVRKVVISARDGWRQCLTWGECKFRVYHSMCVDIEGVRGPMQGASYLVFMPLIRICRGRIGQPDMIKESQFSRAPYQSTYIRGLHISKLFFVWVGLVPDPKSHFSPDLILYVNFVNNIFWTPFN